MTRTYNDTMFIDTFEHEYTWLNGFMRNVRKFAEKTAIIDPEKNASWTYKALNESSNQLANALLHCGVQKNDVVMVMLANSPEFCFSYIGTRKAGTILMPVNYSLGSRELSLLMEHNKPKALIYGSAYKDTVTQAIKACSWQCSVYVQVNSDSTNATVTEGHISYTDFTKDESTENPVLPFRPHIYDEVLRLCTSGTTALAKSVPLNDINEVLSAHDVIMHYPMNKNDVTLNMTPWFHRGGCHSGGVCPTFYAGATLVVMRKFNPGKVLDYVQQHSVTFLTGVPSNLDLLCMVQQIRNCNLSSLHGIVTMGSPLTKEKCLKYMQTLTPNIFNGYGTTETFWNSFLSLYNLPEKAGSAGSSCIDDEIRIVKHFAERRAEPDELVQQDGTSTGEIIIRCPEKTTYSYYENEEEQQKKFYKGWVYTGDLGTWDSDFTITITGRKDNMLIIAGENVYPEQIEAAACACPLIKDCLVTGVEDERRGQCIAAYIVPDRENKDFSIQAVKDFCTASPDLSKYKVPRYYAITDSLPYNSTGKKDRIAIKKQAAKDLKDGILKRQ